MKTTIPVILLICLAALPLRSLAAQKAAGTPEAEIRREAARITTVMEWDSSFTAAIDQTLTELASEHGSLPALDTLYHRLLRHYGHIDKFNKSRVKQSFEEALLFWAAPLLEETGDTAALTNKIIRGFPDTYFPAAVLMPDLITDSAAAVMAASYPKELLYALRYMPGTNALRDAELAAISAPDEARQYLHYANNVNTLLRRSEHPVVGTLLDIYGQYRYNSNGYFLLHLLAQGELSTEEAHETGKDREAFFNALMRVYAEPGAAGRYSADEALGELTDRLVRKLMFQRYLPASRLSLDQLGVLSPEAVAYFLFRSQNLFKKKDLENLAVLLERHEIGEFPAEFATWVPREWAVALETRFTDEGLTNLFAPYIGTEFWARVHPPEPEPPALAETTAGTDAETTAAPEAEAVVPAEPEYVFVPYAASLSEKQKKEILLENNPWEWLRDLDQLTATDTTGTYLVQLAGNFPVEVMAQLEKFADKPYAAAVCRAVAVHAPLTAKNYLQHNGHPIHQYIREDTTAPVRVLYAIGKEAGEWTRAYMLLDKIVSGELTIAEADSICSDKDQRLNHLADIYMRPGHLGAYTVRTELQYAALDFVRAFNIAENTGGNGREALEALDARRLYLFLLLGEQEIIGRTFHKMFDRLMALTGDGLGDLLEKWSAARPGEFVRLALHYGREGDLFSRFTADEEAQLLERIFAGLESGGQSPLQATISAAEMLMAMNDYDRLRRVQEIIRREYDRLGEASHDEGVAAYGVLAGVMAQKLREGWAMYAAPHYRIPDLVTIPVYSLFNDELVNVQHYYFYNDRDGQLSYRNFVRQYEGSSFNWKIEDLGSFIRVVSVAGKRVEIYANKPEAGEAGIAELEAWMKAHRLEPQVVVHRGLSTHTLKTFRKIPPSARLILDGSCGGFHIQTVALQNAPGAHMLCNRNIGTMHINDPMFKQISESIRLGRDIEWPRFWQDMEARLGSNPYFTDYIPPHKNVAALIIKAYYDVLGVSN